MFGSFRITGCVLALLAAMLGGIASSCSAPTATGSSALGRKAILYDVDRYLSAQDCLNAVAAIEDLYESSASDNEIRLKAASAYGCHAGINFFGMTGDIAEHAADLVGPAFWNTMAEFFPSTTGSDYKQEGALAAMSALQAALIPGSVVLPANRINPTSNNVGSVFATDRIDDANIYLVYAAMAAIGSIESRFGSPDPTTYDQGTLLPWTAGNSAGIEGDGCSLASSVVNLLDAIDAVSGVVSGSLATTLANIHTSLEAGINGACDAGCSTLAVAGCNLPAGTCSECPRALRDRTKCSAVTTDPVSCAAAGIVNFINTNWAGP